MGWERRKRGGLYYTRSRKIKGRVVREYVGGGLAGQLAATIDAAHRAERQAREKALRDERDCLEAADAQVVMLCGVVEALVRETLIQAGYHQHHRGEWRRKREEVQSKQ